MQSHLALLLLAVCVIPSAKRGVGAVLHLCETLAAFCICANNPGGIVILGKVLIFRIISFQI